MECMDEDAPSKTTLRPSTHPDPPPPPPNLDPLCNEFPCLPSKHFPIPEPLNPDFTPSKALPDSNLLPPSRNPWLKSPLLGQIITRKYVLRFIPPTLRGKDQVGICPGEAVAGELKILDLTLVGFFLGKKPGFSYVRSNLLKQWKIRGSVQMLQLTLGGFAFRFSDISDRDQILETGVFYVGGQPIFIRSWERNLHTGGLLGLKQLPLWVSLPGLPLHLWGEESLSVVCSVLGKPLYSDRITAEKSRWSYARACVEFSGSSPLLDSITIEDDVGNVFQQPVKYDWKPPHCLSCGIFGHTQESCKRDPRGAEHEDEVAHAAKNQSRNPNMKKQDSPPQPNEEETPKSEKDRGKNTIPDPLTRGKGKTFSELMQKRSTMLLRGWNPIRVKKTGSAGHETTRIRKSLHVQVQNSDPSQPPIDVSESGALDDDLIPRTEMECQAKSFASSPVLAKNSNLKQPAPCSLPLSNRFDFLDMDVDTSLCTQPQVLSLSACTSDLAHDKEAGPSSGLHDLPCEGLNQGRITLNLPCEPDNFEKYGTENDIPLGQIITPVNTSSGGLNMNRTISKPSKHSSSNRCSTHPNQLSISPTPDQSRPCSGAESSSVGRTPYHSRISNLTHPDLSSSIPSNILNSMNMNGDDPDHMLEPIPYGNSADDMAEDIEDEVHEEVIGAEEDIDEDSEEDKEKHIERVDAVEETARRKKWSYSGRYDDLWVTTTDLNDPRRINFW